MKHLIISNSPQAPRDNQFLLGRAKDQVGFLSPDEREYWEERAAIMEYEGGLPRRKAEIKAFECLNRRREYLRKTG
jgi:ribosome modulation factor